MKYWRQNDDGQHTQAETQIKKILNQITQQLCLVSSVANQIYDLLNYDGYIEMDGQNIVSIWWRLMMVMMMKPNWYLQLANQMKWRITIQVLYLISLKIISFSK